MSEDAADPPDFAASASSIDTPSREDILRARDRLKVAQTRSAGHSLRLLWLLAGPGVLVMLGENDGPSMVSYATTGATYGVGFFVPICGLEIVWVGS